MPFITLKIWKSISIAFFMIILISCNQGRFNTKPSIHNSSLAKRYTSDSISSKDLTGKWRLTNESSRQIDLWQKRWLDWDVWICPFESIEITDKEVVKVNINANIKKIDSTYIRNETLIGTWTTSRDSVGDYYYDGSIPTTKLDMYFRYPKNALRVESLNIMNKEKTILWTYIGDPDSRNFLEFVKE